MASISSSEAPVKTVAPAKERALPPEVPRKKKICETDAEVAKKILDASAAAKIDISGGKIRRSSSRFCFGVEHGDYNGTELFGCGANRFIWLAYKPNKTKTVRLFSTTYPCPVSKDGIVTFEAGAAPAPNSKEQVAVADSWARFPYGVDFILSRAGFKLTKGFDCAIFSNIPGGGMSRSASLSINLVLTMLEVNGHVIDDKDRYRIVELAQMVENDYIGSPCGNLDQVMILYAKAGFGTHFIPAKRGKRGGEVRYVPLGGGMSAEDFRIIALDTGTDRPGLEKSTYAIRAAECKRFSGMLAADAEMTALRSGTPIATFADVNTPILYEAVLKKYAEPHPDLCDRLTYIYEANIRFKALLAGWKSGDLAKIAGVFRADGIGLRDTYKISGPELETMCNIARTVPGVLGERMLGGGDKGAAGAIAKAGSEQALKLAVDMAYPRAYPELKNKYKVHVCKIAQGVATLNGLL